MLTCPFCGAPESDRLELDGHRFIVFPCLFTPEVDPTLTDEAISEHLRRTYTAGGDAFFRGMCDRLHLYVTKGEGARALLRPPASASPRPPG